MHYMALTKTDYTMRCKNCGWENPNGLTKCEKCNTPLAGAVNNQPAYGTVPEAPQAAQNLNKTVFEAEVFPQAAPAANACPNCGYPMRPGVTDCPNCHQQAAQPVAPQPAPRPAAPAPQQVKAAPMSGTVNPWVQVAPANKCSLIPVEQQGVETPATLNLKGDAHDLNRANLDPENQTITSKVQAQLTCEDGQWYIQDKSTQHTTFIYAGEKTALKEGDVILMGNRQFVFHID